MITHAPRFVAEWITKQHEGDGEWSPDKDEYGESTHSTLEEAQAAAVAGSKTSEVEWVRVTEYHFNADVRIPARSWAAWDAVRSWHGDWLSWYETD